jgi:endonuclease-8
MCWICALTVEQVKARLLSAKFRNRQFSGLLLDQAFLAGLGNYLRVEILWQVGLTGRHKAAELDENSWMRWRMRCWISRACPTTPAVWWMRISTTARCFALRFSIAMGRCERCGGIIERTMLSSRPFYWCPGCQQ